MSRPLAPRPTTLAAVAAAVFALACGAGRPPAIGDTYGSSDVSYPDGGGDFAADAGATGAGTPGRPTSLFPLGSIVDESVGWMGWPEGASAATAAAPIWLRDYLDPDGKKGITAILVVSSTLWCPYCQTEAAQIESLARGSFKTRGARVIELVIQSAGGARATTKDAKLWKSNYGLTMAVGADPWFTFALPGSNGLPLHALVDPRTGEVVERIDGWGGLDALDAEVEALVARNSP